MTLDRLLKEIVSRFDGNSIAGLTGFSAAIAVGERKMGRTLVVAPEDRAILLHHNLMKLGYNPLFFPDSHVLPYEDKPPESSHAAYRINILNRLLRMPECIVVSTPSALFFPFIREELLTDMRIPLYKGMKMDVHDLSRSLADIGYGREEQVELLGTFARRGDIVDVFSPTH